MEFEVGLFRLVPKTRVEYENKINSNFVGQEWKINVNDSDNPDFKIKLESIKVRPTTHIESSEKILGFPAGDLSTDLSNHMSHSIEKELDKYNVISYPLKYIQSFLRRTWTSIPIFSYESLTETAQNIDFDYLLLLSIIASRYYEILEDYNITSTMIGHNEDWSVNEDRFFSKILVTNLSDYQERLNSVINILEDILRNKDFYLFNLFLSHYIESGEVSEISQLQVAQDVFSTANPTEIESIFRTVLLSTNEVYEAGIASQSIIPYKGDDFQPSGLRFITKDQYYDIENSLNFYRRP